MTRILSPAFLLLFLFSSQVAAWGFGTGFVADGPNLVELTGTISATPPSQEDASIPILEVVGKEMYFFVARARSLNRGLSEIRLLSSLRSPPWGWRLRGRGDLLDQLLSQAAEEPYRMIRLKGLFYFDSQTLHVLKVSFS